MADIPAKAQDPVVEIAALTRKFGELTAVDAVTLTIDRGRFSA